MIIYSIAEGLSSQLCVNVPFCSTGILGSDISIINSDQILLRVPHEIECFDSNRLRHESAVHLKNRFTDKTAVLYCSMYDRNFSVFRYYRNRQIITIGSSIDDDLYLMDSNISEHHFEIDTQKKTITDTKGSLLGSLNRTVFRAADYHTSDQFSVLNLRIIFHENFIMVNSPENLRCFLERSIPEEESGPLSGFEKIKIVRRYRNPDISRHMEIVLEEPLPFEKKEYSPIVFSMGPALTMSAASLTVGLLSAYNGWLSGRDILTLLPMVVLPAVMIISTLLWNPLHRIYDRHKEKKRSIDRIYRYDDYLSGIKKDIREFQKNYKAICSKEFSTVFNTDILYQKTERHSDWLMVLCGTGRICFDIHIKSNFHLKYNDPLKIKISELNTLFYDNDMPLLISLNQYRHIHMNWNEQWFQYFLMQICMYFGYDRLCTVFLCDEKWLALHGWIRKIPHTLLERRLIACSVQQAVQIDRCLSKSGKTKIVFVFRNDLEKAISQEGVFIRINSSEPENDSDLIINCKDGKGTAEDGRSCQEFSYDLSQITDPESWIEMLNIYSLSQDERSCGRTFSFYDLYHISNPKQLLLNQRYETSKCSEGIRVPIGFTDSGEEICVDLSEKGHGPHGLIAGMTGSGKSELIITLILSLTVCYSPSQIQIVMIDFKGGGAARLFANDHYTLPHIAGILSDLDFDEIERALVSFRLECQRRENLFQKMSAVKREPVSGLSAYQDLLSEGDGFPSLASLLIIVDEFAELKREKPEFMKDLISIARIGRSLGIHMILSTQKPSGIVDDQIWSNCRFKICLKVQQKSDSIEVIHTPDASNILNPGEFYFLCDSEMIHGRCAYANSPETEYGIRVKLLDHMKNVKASAEKNTRSSAQAGMVINEILKTEWHEKAEPLWLPPLTHQLIPSGCFGYIDDYYSRSYRELYFDCESFRPMGVFTVSRKERKLFLANCIMAVMKQIGEHDEIYLIDDMNIHTDAMHNVRHVCGIFSACDTDRIKVLFRHLREDKRSTSMVYLMLTDLSSFYSADDEHRILLHEILEHAESYRVKAAVFMSSASVLSYRDLSLISERIVLNQDNPQEISSVFECPSKRTCTREGYGLIRNDHILEFCYPVFPDTVINSLMKSDAGSLKTFTLPCIPDHVPADMCITDDLFLGVNPESYEQITVSRNRMLLIIATYEEELADISYIMKIMADHVYYMPDEQTIERAISETGGVFIMSLDHYQKSSLKNSRTVSAVLFAGSGYADQYLFNAGLKIQLQYNQAVFFDKGRSQVIQLVEYV